MAAILPPKEIVNTTDKYFNGEGAQQAKEAKPKKQSNFDWGSLFTDVGEIAGNVGNIIHNVKKEKEVNPISVVIPGAGGPTTGGTVVIQDTKKPFPWTPVIIIGGALVAITTVGFFTNWFGLTKK